MGLQKYMTLKWTKLLKQPYSIFFKYVNGKNIEFKNILFMLVDCKSSCTIKKLNSTNYIFMTIVSLINWVVTIFYNCFPTLYKLVSFSFVKTAFLEKFIV